MKHLFLLTFFIYSGILFSQSLNEPKQPEAESYVLETHHSTATPLQAWVFSPEAPIGIEKGQIVWWKETAPRKVKIDSRYLATIHSRGNRFFGILSLKTVSNNPRKPKRLQIEVYSALQEKLFTLERSLHYDDPYPVVALSDRDGAVVLGQVTNGEMEFYNHRGELLRKVALFPEVEYDLERTLLLDLSADGSTVAVVASKRGVQPAGASNETSLFLFKSDGTLLLQKPLDNYVVHSAAISPDGNTVVAACYTLSGQQINGQALLFNRAGEQIFRTDLLFKQARFSPDGRAVLLFNNREARVVDLQNKTVSYRYTVAGQEKLIAEAQLSQDGQRAVLLLARSEFRTNAFVFSQPIVQILDQQGRRLSEIKMEAQTFRTPALQIRENAKEILIGFEQGYQIYRVK